MIAAVGRERTYVAQTSVSDGALIIVNHRLKSVPLRRRFGNDELIVHADDAFK
jgi:hypothetical protein